MDQSNIIVHGSTITQYQTMIGLLVWYDPLTTVTTSEGKDVLFLSQKVSVFEVEY